jgi:phosphoribosylformylglycinamidine synthase
MNRPLRAAVILFPGSNREGDVARALRQASGVAPAIVWHDDRALPAGVDLVVLPGGFSYGDYLRCGAIAARARIMDAVRAHAAAGGLVLGICNGFQILCEAGLLPGVLMRNAGRRFVCKMQHLRVENEATPFSRGYEHGQVVKVAIAHGEGNYTIDAAGLAELERSGRVAFRYCDANGAVGGEANPNGSMNDIAGVYNETFNVLGLMPHPENLIDPLVGGIDGRGMFDGLSAA